MSGFGKVWSDIVTSSVWCKDDKTLRVWIAMIATSEADGFVSGSIPGFARLCGISVDEMERIIEDLSSPDKYSRTPDNEGRRIRSVDGGWQILNHAKYRGKRDPEQRRKQVREATARYRERKSNLHVIHCDPSVIQGEPPRAQAEAEADAEAKNKDSCSEPQAASEPEPGIESFPVVGKPEMPNGWKIPKQLANDLRRAYPALNLVAELNKARAWLVANPQRRKTARGMARFLNGWLERSQNTNSKAPNRLAPSTEDLAYLQAGGPGSWGIS